MSVTIGIVDDQQLFLKSLVALINTITRFEVIVEALSGPELLKKMKLIEGKLDILLLDVQMNGMDGIETAQALSVQYPSVKLAALTTQDDDITIIKMLNAGCCAYLLKDIHPEELVKALDEIAAKGFYNGDSMNIRYRRLLTHGGPGEKIELSEREMTFLKFACSDRTYKQIASEMNLAERTIDGYREVLFEKLNVQSRVGMAMEAIRRKFVKL